MPTPTAAAVIRIARDCGFELAGIARAEALPEAEFYQHWAAAGMAGEMRYLTDHRAALRNDPRQLLETARSVLCVGKLYNTAAPYSVEAEAPGRGWISRYAWGADYHDFVRTGLDRVVERLRTEFAEPLDARVLVDTAPLLERAYARRAGLGWIGRNTCLINEPEGSWFFLGEVLLSWNLDPAAPPPDRCGTCRRCIDACPTDAIVPNDTGSGPEWTLDSRRCISYFTIELKGPSPTELRPGTGWQVFGCDICQDVCPWNRKAPVTADANCQPASIAPSLEWMGNLSEGQFREIFRDSPVWRARHRGFLRNVAIAMGNDADERHRDALERLAEHGEEVVRDAARWALGRLDEKGRLTPAGEPPRER